MSNTFMKFIDSCVGAIARKVQDEFDEGKHPRDKGGKFTSKGNEERGGGADDEGYMGLSKEELAEEEEYENARERARREKDDDRVTGPEDWDYMNEEDDEDSESGVEDIQKSLRRNVASSVEDLLEYTKDDGYDAELVSDEFMIVRKDDKEYRAHIDRAGSSYYVDRVEEW